MKIRLNVVKKKRYEKASLNYVSKFASPPLAGGTDGHTVVTSKRNIHVAFGWGELKPFQATGVTSVPQPPPPTGCNPVNYTNVFILYFRRMSKYEPNRC